VRRRFAKAAAVIGAAFYLLPGLWAFLDPQSFAENTEKAPPVHLVHDMGAFMVGLGLWAIASLIFSDILLTAVAALAATSVLSAYVHFHDQHMGGVRASEPWILVAVALAEIIALIACLPRRPRAKAPAAADQAKADQVPAAGS
jgi:hypothetical protein